MELIKGNKINTPQNLYQTKEWTNFIETAYSIDIYTLEITLKNNTMQLLLPIKNNRIIIPPLWAYNLPVFSHSPDLNEQLLFIDNLNKTLKQYTSFVFDFPSHYHTYTFAKYATPYYEFVVSFPFTPPNNLKESYKKALNKGFDIEQNIHTNTQLLNVFYKQLANQYINKKRKIPYSYNVFLSLHQQPFIETYLMHYNGISSLLSIATFNKQSYGIINIGQNNNILKLYVFDILHKKGIKDFFFVGANTPGIIEHKKRFHPKTLTLTRIRKTGIIDKLKHFIKGVI